MSTRRNEILTGVVAITLFWGGLAASELTLRAIQQARFGVATTVEQSDQFFIDRATGLRRPVANRRLGKVRINNLSFRGPDISPERSPNSLRLAFIGSSTTYDANSSETENWPARTAALLKDALHGCDVDFVNAASPGYSSTQTLTSYQAYVRPLKPDVVIFMAGDMNQNLNDLAEKRGFEVGAPRSSWLANNTALFGLIEKNYHVLRLQRTSRSTVGKMRVKPEEITAPFERDLDAVSDAVAQSGATLALVTVADRVRKGQSAEEVIRAVSSDLYYMPYMMAADFLPLREAYNDKIRATAQKHGAILIADEDKIPGDDVHFADSKHFSPQGAAVQARRVKDGLLASPKFRELMQRAGCTLATEEERHSLAQPRSAG
jgi:lysophospholipase L1-like esterase